MRLLHYSDVENAYDHPERIAGLAGLIADTLVVRPGANGRVVWEVDLGETVRATRRPVAEAPRHDGVAERLRTRLADAGLAEAVGVADRPLERDRAACFAGETRVMNFITDAYRWASDADVGYVDARMLRGGPALSGEVALAELVGLAPFEADLCRVELSGSALRDLAEQTVATDERARRSPTAEAWWGHFSGMAVVWDRAERAVGEVRVGGDPLDPASTYALGTTEYVVGSDEFPAVSRDRVTDAWGVQYEALAAYAREVGIDPELDGRIRVE